MTAPRRRPFRRPVARLDLARFLELVRDLRTAQLRDDAAGANFHAAETRGLAEQLDGWLLDLGRPPEVPVVWPSEEELAGFAGDAD